MHEEKIKFSRPLLRVRLTGIGEGTGTQGAAGQGSADDRVTTRQAEAPDPWIALQAGLLALAEGVQEIEQRRQQSLAELPEATVELALAVASSIVAEKIDKNEFPIENIVTQMIARLEPGPAVHIRLNPEDLQQLQQRLDGKPPPWNVNGELQLVADATLARGDCAAEAGDFGLVSRIESQMSDLRQLLLHEIEDAQVERRKTEAGSTGIRRFPDRRETA